MRWLWIAAVALAACGGIEGGGSEQGQPLDCDCPAAFCVDGACVDHFALTVDRVVSRADVLSEGQPAFVAVEVNGHEVARTDVREGSPEPVFNQTLDLGLRPGDNLIFWLYKDDGAGFRRNVNYELAGINQDAVDWMMYGDLGSTIWLRFAMEAE